MNLLKYTNGTGHLIMSVLTTIAGLILVIFCKDNATMQGVGVTLILGVNSAWFVSGSAKQVAAEVANLLQQPSGPSVTQIVTAVPKVTTVPQAGGEQ
jgi:hypothetical protein